MKTVLVTSSTGEPITLEELKNHLRIMPGETEDDEYLRTLITMSRERVEEITNRKLMPQTWKLHLNNWPNTDYIQLPYGRVRSVPSTGIVYTNSTNNSTTFSSTAWSAGFIPQWFRYYAIRAPRGRGFMIRHRVRYSDPLPGLLLRSAAGAATQIPVPAPRRTGSPARGRSGRDRG